MRENPKLTNAKGLYLDGIRDGRVREAVEQYTGDRYTQHSTGVSDGVEGFVEFFEPFVERNPNRDIQIVRSIVDDRYVFLHVFQDINDGEARWVTTDLFDTDEHDRIIEHWDVIAPYTPGATAGPAEITDEHHTAANKALVRTFINEVLMGDRLGLAGEFVAESLVEHGELLAPLGSPGGFMYRNVHTLIGEGNFVVTYSLVDTDQALAVFDIWRIDNGVIVEHWINSEPVPTGPQPNGGKF